MSVQMRTGVVVIAVLALLISVPGLSLWLPRAFGLGGGP